MRDALDYPCKDCPDRYPACSDTCPKFQAVKENRQQYQMRRKAELSLDKAYFDGMKRLRDRARDGKLRNK